MLNKKPSFTENVNFMVNSAVNKSKFQSLKNYGSSPQGHVVLQDHGNEVSFRKIKIRKL